MICCSIHVDRGVDDRVPLEGRGGRLDHERHRRELDAAVVVVAFAFVPHVLEFGDVDIVEIRELRDRRVRLDHVAGDGLPHPRHLLEPHAAVVVGVGRAGRRDAARSCGRHLLVRFADVGLHVFDRDSAGVAGRAHVAEIDAQLPREPANGRTGR